MEPGSDLNAHGNEMRLCRCKKFWAGASDRPSSRTPRGKEGEVVVQGREVARREEDEEEGVYSIGRKGARQRDRQWKNRLRRS